MFTFEEDVFLSYRHYDNQDEGNNGWVARFHRSLKIRLTEILGYEPRIWRDSRLQGGEYFADEIHDRLARTKVLVSILSPGYIKSPWCLGELREFSELAEKTKSLRVGNKSRLVKVVKTFLPRDQHPTQLQGQLGYELYDINHEYAGGLPLEFSQEVNGYQHGMYKLKINQIAWYIKEVIELLTDSKSSDIDRTIYVAQTTSDLQAARENIVAELQARKFCVLPEEDKLALVNVKDYQETVSDDLRRSRLSIHLVGNYYGTILEGSDKSIVDLQNDLAAQLSSEDRLARLIWLPPNLVTNETRHADFVNSLRTDADAQKGAQLFERSFEELKTRMIQIITSSRTKLPQDDLIRIYLMCDKLDSDVVSIVENYLFDQRYEVLLPATDGDDGQIMQLHKDTLLVCDAALIYYGNTNESWFRSRLIDLIKARGWGRKAPMLCKGVFITDPQTPHKHRLRTLEALPLPPFFRGIPPESLDASLKPFIDAIENAKIELSCDVRQES